jgi:hypothetical protein
MTLLDLGSVSAPTAGVMKGIVIAAQTSCPTRKI